MVATFNDESQKNSIQSLFPKLKFRCSENRWLGSHLVCAISKKESLAKEAAEYLSNQIDKQGEMLGYPKCCTRQHMDLSIRGFGLNASVSIYESYRKSRKFSFLTNNILNFYSRLGKEENNFGNLRKYNNQNKSFPIPLMDIQFISHIPCRYDCEER